jgi:hypothetical protein
MCKTRDISKPEECVMCSEGCDPAATGRRPHKKFSTEFCVWCDLGIQLEKEHNLKKLLLNDKKPRTIADLIRKQMNAKGAASGRFVPKN